MEIYGGLREGIGINTYFHRPIYFAKTLKLRFRVGGLDLSERRRHTSSREEEEVDAQMCPCDKARKRETHTGECETYKEEQGV